MARFFSRELTEQSIEICNADAEHLERAKLLNGKVILRATDTPDGKDISVTYTFEKGRCTGYDFEEEAAPSTLRDRPFVPLKDGLARVSASYETFVKLDKGELEPADALNSNDYKVEGNMVMLMPLMQAVDSWTRKVREIPKDY
jgi:putative sterol carrier protein